VNIRDLGIVARRRCYRECGVWEFFSERERAKRSGVDIAGFPLYQHK